MIAWSYAVRSNSYRLRAVATAVRPCAALAVMRRKIGEIAHELGMRDAQSDEEAADRERDERRRDARRSFVVAATVET